MESNSRNKLIILVLFLVVIGQSILILRLLPKEKARVRVSRAVKVAIVLDDWGYNQNNLHFLSEIKQSLTVSILPRLAYSQIVAYEARKNGLEVILHLPLEPYPSQKLRLEPCTILTGMDEARARTILKEDLTSVTGASGVSNHMGSRATSDSRLMGVILKDIKERGLYFLDSYSSGKSVVSSVSRRMGARSAKRDVFLDNNSSPAYIKGQILRLVAIAKKQGQAIGIGHDRLATLTVLKEEMPRLEKEGIKFVFVSELTN